MRTVTGLFDTRGQAKRAVEALEDAERRGGTLVTARVDDAHVDAAAAILGQSGSVNIADRRSEYEATGWSGYEEARASDLDPLGSRPVLPGLPR